MHEKASKHNDCHLCDFVEAEYLQEQYKALRDLYSLLTKIKRFKIGVDIHILDTELYQEFKNKKIEEYNFFKNSNDKRIQEGVSITMDQESSS